MVWGMFLNLGSVFSVRLVRCLQRAMPAFCPGFLPSPRFCRGKEANSYENSPIWVTWVRFLMSFILVECHLLSLCVRMCIYLEVPVFKHTQQLRGEGMPHWHFPGLGTSYQISLFTLILEEKDAEWTKGLFFLLSAMCCVCEQAVLSGQCCW